MKVTCTWGDGPDVMLSLDGSIMVIHNDPLDKDAWAHGTVSDGSLDLTADEAEELAYGLIASAKAARELKKSYAEYMERELCQGDLIDDGNGREWTDEELKKGEEKVAEILSVDDREMAKKIE